MKKLPTVLEARGRRNITNALNMLVCFGYAVNSNALATSRGSRSQLGSVSVGPALSCRAQCNAAYSSRVPSSADLSRVVSRQTLLRVVREAMVTVMLSALPPALRSGAGGALGERFQRDQGEGALALGGGVSSDEGASTCALWCAIAIGSLVQGSPFDTVSRWVRRDLEAHDVVTCTEVYTASTLLMI